MKAAIAPSLTAPAGTKGDVAAELHERCPDTHCQTPDWQFGDPVTFERNSDIKDDPLTFPQ
jgi:hypothetical protein